MTEVVGSGPPQGRILTALVGLVRAVVGAVTADLRSGSGVCVALHTSPGDFCFLPRGTGGGGVAKNIAFRRFSASERCINVPTRGTVRNGCDVIAACRGSSVKRASIALKMFFVLILNK